ncbi:hypothetical protein IWQ60_003410 [Tieghemiomyces parasiticus]|uniref:P-type ATPase A domain-containing protein n=1 Tax=Tieghemiomyces parasiticus TaxID=78921 RepID=A0A9W8A9M9_9FUNG|nr:hypothetical protein IWQ60_003410 [Tieghemiomyces parasiticus]
MKPLTPKALWLTLAVWTVSSVLTLVSASPIFNTPNQFGLDGKVCPRFPRRNVNCPQICVSDLADCPKSLQPACPPGERFCANGECARECPADLVNPCQCGGIPYPTGDRLVPCRRTPTIDIPAFNFANRTAQTHDACGVAINDTRILDYGALPIGPLWLDCPSPGDDQSFTFHEPAWLALWLALAAQAAVFSLWYGYKQLRERRVPRVPLEKSGLSGVTSYNGTSDHLSDDAGPDDESLDDTAKKPQVRVLCDSSQDSAPAPSLPLLRFTGYRNDWIGTLIVYAIGLLSVGWIVWMAMLTADYYGKFIGPPFSLAHQNFDLSAKLFIASWHFMAAWFLGLNVTRARLRNFFRIRTSAERSHVVQVEQEVAPLILLDDDRSSLLRRIRRLERSLKLFLGWHLHVTTAPLHRTAHGRLYFNYQCTRYVFNPKTHDFEPFEFPLGNTTQDLMALSVGLAAAEAEYRSELLGPNFISVEVPSIPLAFVREFTDFFYLYQLTVLWLFYYYAYYNIGLVDTAVIFVSAFVKVFIRRNSECRLKRMAEHEDTCQVYRDGAWAELSTAELVPGDLIEIRAHQLVPCDAVILSGNVVVDESSLTGEPLPVRKFPLRAGSPFDINGSGKLSALFSGTIISQAEPDKIHPRATALVYRIGTATDKGQLVRKILFPSPVSFIFDEQLKIVMGILALEGLVAFGIGIWMQRQDLNVSWFNGMFCLAQIVSPILPAALVVGQSVASTRLRKKHIFCVDLPRIMVAGKVQIFCFDKTGTLTKEGLDFYGCQSLDHLGESYDNLPSSREDLAFEPRTLKMDELPRLMQMAVASCHSVTELNGQLIGNPVDIEMFRSTGWDLCHPESPEYLDTLCNQGEKLHVVKRFEFVHARMSMSVAVLDVQTDHVHVYVKGSFEKIKDLVDPASLPANYDRVTSQLAREGCYVLAVAHRDLGPLSGNMLNNYSRDELERGAAFIGLVLFKNTLKPDTADAIAELKSGTTRTVMITGDTALTGAFISRACGMSSPADRMLLGDVGKDGELIWRDVDTDEPEDLHTALLTARPRSAGDTDSVKDDKAQLPALSGQLPPVPSGDIELAVTGKAFNELVRQDLIRTYLLNIRVFARMTPQDKVTCVQLHMERGITAMCGDGGNDCGALRAAHVGIALSEAEASIVSPFSTSVRSIYSCVELLRQGRAALATSFAGYKYLILYGQTMVLMKANTFYFQGTLTESLWIFIDAFITLGMTACIPLSKASRRLAPQRPTARLLGPQTLLSTIGVVAINWVFVIVELIWLYQQPWFRCHEFDSTQVDISKWWLLGDNYESAILALTVFQFINAGAIFNFGHHFRRAWARNYPLVVLWAVVVGIMSYVLLADPNRLGCLFRINCGDPNVLQDLGYSRPGFAIEPYNIPQGHNVFPSRARWALWAMCLANMAAGLLWERLVILGPVRRYFMKKYPLRRLRLKY